LAHINVGKSSAYYKTLDVSIIILDWLYNAACVQQGD